MLSTWTPVAVGDNAVFTSCGNRGTNHAVGAIGWKTIGDKVYFILANQWGQWGNTGGKPGGDRSYALMGLGCDEYGDEIAFLPAETDPTPCKPPYILLPVEVTAHTGDEIVLAVKKVDGISYQWFKDGVKVGGDSSAIGVIAGAADTEYKVIGKNSCGTAESKTRLKPIASVVGQEDVTTVP